MSECIRQCWTVEGFYRLVSGTLAWKYVRRYREGEVVWEFGDGTLTCYIDGLIDHSVKYTIFHDNILMIYFPGMTPYFSWYVKRYMIVKRHKDLWLCDTDRPAASAGFKLAIKLSPVK